MRKKRAHSALENFKALGYVFANSLKILWNEPKLLWLFAIEVLLNTFISFCIYHIALNPNFQLYSQSVRFWQIDPLVNGFGDFLKLLVNKKIPLLLFGIETLRSSLLFFIGTITAVVLGRSVHKSIDQKKFNIFKEWMLEGRLIRRIIYWTVLHQAIFLSGTFILDYALQAIPFMHHLYYAFSFMGAAILVFYINPIFAFEDKPLHKALAEVFVFIYKTWVINLVWIIIGALWFTFMTDPRLKVTLENITPLSGLLLSIKLAISPIAAVLWYRSIKQTVEE